MMDYQTNETNAILNQPLIQKWHLGKEIKE